MSSNFFITADHASSFHKIDNTILDPFIDQNNRDQWKRYSSISDFKQKSINMKDIRSTIAVTFALCSAIHGGGVGAFQVPTRSTPVASSLPAVPDRHSEDSRDEPPAPVHVAPESRRAVLGRAVLGGLAATMIPLVSLPSQGIAASPPAKVGHRSLPRE